uniref:Uncharacterized protein n=1 Tax=Rhizophora mucronata TaxID=61149 RepID=A0A2P2Q146_RHIMU
MIFTIHHLLHILSGENCLHSCFLSSGEARGSNIKSLIGGHANRRCAKYPVTPISPLCKYQLVPRCIHNQ